MLHHFKRWKAHKTHCQVHRTCLHQNQGWKITFMLLHSWNAPLSSSQLILWPVSIYMSPSPQQRFTEFKGWRKSKVNLGLRWISGKMGLIWQHLFQTLRKMDKWWVKLQSSWTINCSVQWVFPVILGPSSPWKKCQDTAFLLQHQANMPNPFPAIL